MAGTGNASPSGRRKLQATLRIRVSREVFDELDAWAEEEAISRSALVRRLIQRLVRRRRSRETPP